MELELEEMFGLREIANRSEGGSEADDDDDDDGGRNNPMEEAMEVPDPEAGGGPSAEAKVVKPKRVIKNPMPKLDPARIAGPRGIPVVQKFMKNVKFRGKGHEKEDLDVLLKHLEHWAHRMYPRFPFKNMLEHLERLGARKPVQNMMKRYRLDMFEEFGQDDRGEDDVLRGVDEEDNPEPVVDVFDELLGTSFPKTSQPTTVLSNPSQPKPGGLTDEQRERLERNKRLAAEKRLANDSHVLQGGLTDEQRERLERNKRLAAEKRLAKLREQQTREKMDTSSHAVDHFESSDFTDDFGSRKDPAEDTIGRMETEDTGKAVEREEHRLVTTEGVPVNDMEVSQGLSKGVNPPANDSQTEDKVSEVKEGNVPLVTGDKNQKDELQSTTEDGSGAVSLIEADSSVNGTANKAKNNENVGRDLLLHEVDDKEKSSAPEGQSEGESGDDSRHSDLVIDEAYSEDGKMGTAEKAVLPDNVDGNAAKEIEKENLVTAEKAVLPDNVGGNGAKQTEKGSLVTAEKAVLADNVDDNAAKETEKASLITADDVLSMLHDNQ